MKQGQGSSIEFVEFARYLTVFHTIFGHVGWISRMRKPVEGVRGFVAFSIKT